MRGRNMAGAIGLGCAGLSVLGMLTFVAPQAAEASPGRACGAPSDCEMPAGEVASNCEDAMMNTRRGGSGGVKLTADVPDRATVAPGQDITVRLAWDPKDWSADELDMALACVRVKGGLDSNLSDQERPTANDGTFEYRLHVPDNIKPGCDICVQGFLAGMTDDGGQRVGSNEQCFMSGTPEKATPPAPASPAPTPTAPTPVAPAPAAPAPAAQEPPRAPAEVPSQVAGSNVSRPAPAPDPAPQLLGELPRTGPTATRLGTAGGGLTLALGGLAVIGGAGRRARRRLGV